MPKGVEHPDDPLRDDLPPSRPTAEARGLVEGRTRHEPRPDTNGRKASDPRGRPDDATDPGWVIETVFSPFHCLYQDALFFHTQSRLAKSDAEASRLARAALLLYISAAESLVHQAAEELGRHELRGLIADPSRPLPLAEAWRLLPAIAAEPGSPTGPFDPETPPWPQFAELLMLRTSWAYPGSPGVAARLLPLLPPRRRLRALAAAPGPLRPEEHRGPRSARVPAHRIAPRSLCPPPPPRGRRPRHPRRRHRGPRPPHGRRAHPGPAAPPRARPTRPPAGRYCPGADCVRFLGGRGSVRASSGSRLGRSLALPMPARTEPRPPGSDRITRFSV